MARVEEEKTAKGILTMLSRINKRLETKAWDRKSDTFVVIHEDMPYDWNVIKYIQNRLSYGGIECKLYSFEKVKHFNHFTWSFKVEK